MGSLANAADLLKHTGRRFAEVQVGQMTVRIRSITEREHAQVERRLVDSASRANGNSEQRRAEALAEGNALLLCYCVCGEDDEPLFAEGDVGRLGDLDAGLTQVLVSACMQHCGLLESDLKELAKNSAETAGGGPPTG